MQNQFCQRNEMKIVKGEDKVVQVVLQKKLLGSDINEPSNLANKTVLVKFKAGTLQSVSATIIDANLGKISFPIDKATSVKFTSPSVSIDVYVTDNTTSLTEITKISNALQILESEK